MLSGHHLGKCYSTHESAPYVRAGCPPMRATTVPRGPITHLDEKSLSSSSFCPLFPILPSFSLPLLSPLFSLPLLLSHACEEILSSPPSLWTPSPIFLYLRACTRGRSFSSPLLLSPLSFLSPSFHLSKFPSLSWIFFSSSCVCMHVHAWGGEIFLPLFLSRAMENFCHAYHLYTSSTSTPFLHGFCLRICMHKEKRM